MEKRMKYATYKKAYPTAKTIPGSYDPATKTIIVVIPGDKPTATFTKADAIRQAEELAATGEYKLG